MKIYIITTPLLTNRKKYIDSIINQLNLIYDNNIDIELIDKTIKIENIKEKTKLEKVNIEEFDKSLTHINNNIVDNIERHKLVYSKIIHNNIDYAWVLEDDVVISTDYIENLKNFIKIIKDIKSYDIIFTGFTSSNDANSDIKIMNLNKDTISNIIPSKGSYIISNNLAKKLYNDFDVYKYSMRIQLSKFLLDNKDIKVGIINKYLFLEASKIGILPTSINKNNILIFNTDYIKLIKELNSNNIETAKILFNKLKNINSVDVFHLMGIIYHKNNLNEDALECFEKSMCLLKEQKGYIGKDSEILNNCINIYQYNQ